jgi:hypothetical protein
MTPLIREMVALSPDDAANYMWFDMTPVFKEYHRPTGEELALPMPFNLCGVVTTDADNHKVLLLIRDAGPARGITGWVMRKHDYRALPSFVYDRTDPLNPDGTIRIKLIDNDNKDPLTKESVQVTVALLSVFLVSVHSDKPVDAYQPVAKQSFINAKRAKKGKPPLYEWRTVAIEPVRPKAEPQGGTHASPRLHDRRGHFRTMRSGKKVWVKACKVGDASRGTVFHDYEVRA